MKVSQNVSFTFIEENKETDDVILQKIYSDDNGRVKKREVFINEKSKYYDYFELTCKSGEFRKDTYRLKMKLDYGYLSVNETDQLLSELRHILKVGNEMRDSLENEGWIERF